MSDDKVPVTIRMDKDIVEGFKKIAAETPGAKYQSLMNDVLRAHLEKGRGESIDARLTRLENIVLKKR